MNNACLDNAVAIVGRKNSGKTTLSVEIIRELTTRGYVVSSIKHHSHDNFEIDFPGKDSWLHHRAGTIATGVVSATRFGLVDDSRHFDGPLAEHYQALSAIGSLPASNIVIVEGYKRAGLPTIELFRRDNPRDVEAAPAFLERLNNVALGAGEMPAAIVTDMPELATAALCAAIPAFGFYDISQISAWIAEHFSKPLLSVSIQAGGESRRMGKSKALVSFHGLPLIEHMVARFAPIAADLMITTNEPEELLYLQTRYPGLRLTPDTFKKRGAVQGFATALYAARYPMVAVVGCDMVNLPPALIEYEAKILEKSLRTEAFIPYDAVVPVSQAGVEPFCGVYERDRCMAATKQSIDLKKVRMRHVIEQLNVCTIDTFDSQLCPEGSFTNVNTPEDLKRAEQY